MALAPLSTTSGTDIPRRDAAITTIGTALSFIKNNPDTYSLIHLFVKKRFEFEWYKNELEAYWNMLLIHGDQFLN